MQLSPPPPPSNNKILNVGLVETLLKMGHGCESVQSTIFVDVITQSNELTFVVFIIQSVIYALLWVLLLSWTSI